MMKSFFKKLAFVMALAMVVATMAPAATASAAEALGIVAQNDDTWTVLESDEVELGVEGLDYKYKNAPSDYAKLSPEWDSSDKTVATVDKYGKVTTLKAGETVISIALSNGQKGELKLTVKAPEADDSFTVEQTTYTLAELTFANKEITQADVEKNLKVEWIVVDDYAAPQPFQVVGVKDGVATINVYGFNDGVKYVFTYADAEPVVLDATIGDVASIEVKAYADAACSADLEHVAYVGQDATIKYVLKNAKGVDITDVALANNASAYVEYKLGTDSTIGEYWLNDMTGTATDPNGKIFFTVANKSVTVTAKFVTGKFDSNTGLPIEGPTSDPYTVFSTNPPAYRITSKVGVTVNGNWNAPTTTLALDDEYKYSNKVVFKFKDSDKKDVFTNDATYTKGEFSFKSTNPAVAFINPTTGAITTNTEGSTTVLVYFKPAPTTAVPNPVATLVAADTITVAAKRAVASINPAGYSVVVSSDSTNNFNEGTLTFELKDKLNALIDAADGKLKVERNKATLPTGISAPTVTWTRTAEGKYTIKVVGSTANVGDATSYLFTYEIKADGAPTQTFTVTVRKPIYANGELVVSGHEIVTNNVTDLKTENDAAKTLTATVNVQSNAVNVKPVEVIKSPGKDYQVGNYYYTVTKNGSDITSKTSVASDNKTINIGLTSVATASAVGGANVVNKGANGQGTYVITVYKAVGATVATTTQALSIVQTKTVNVGDTQKTVAFVSKNNAEVAPNTVEAMVLAAYAFKYDNTTFGANGTALPGNIIMTVDAKKPNDTVLKGDVVFVRSVTFYVKTSATSNTYTTNTVTINDYITAK